MHRPFWLTKLFVRTGFARWLPSVRKQMGGGIGYLRYCSDRGLAIPLEELIALSDYWSTSEADSIDLAKIGPRLDAPSPARIASPRGYPQPGGGMELRSAIADHLCNGGLTVDAADEVLVTPGAISAWSTALDTFVNPGDRVVAFEPCSPLFNIGLKHRRARVHWIATATDNGFVRFDVNRLRRALSGAKMIVLSHPVNPTGGVFAAEELDQIAWWANRRNVLIYCDESFAAFRFEGEHVSLGSLESARRRTLTAGSLSFGWGQAALRIGWLAGYRHLLGPCAVMCALNNPFIPSANQQSALMALRQSPTSQSAMRDSVAEKRLFIHERLRDLGFDPNWPAGGLFAWFSVKPFKMQGREFADRLFAEKRVLVSPGELFGPSAADYVRLSLAADDGRLREGLTRLAEFVEKLRAPSSGESASAPPVPQEAPTIASRTA